MAQCEGCGNDYEKAFQHATSFGFLISIAADGTESVRLGDL